MKFGNVTNIVFDFEYYLIYNVSEHIKLFKLNCKESARCETELKGFMLILKEVVLYATYDLNF